jgi:hypothetical protein
MYDFVIWEIWQRIWILYIRFPSIKLYDKPLVSKNTHLLVEKIEIEILKI